MTAKSSTQYKSSSEQPLITIGICVPILNADRVLDDLNLRLNSQSIQIETRLLVDSESIDDSASRAQGLGFRVHKISRAEFNHGGTRQLAGYLEKPSRAARVQGGRSAATETYQIDRRGSEHRPTQQSGRVIGFSRYPAVELLPDEDVIVFMTQDAILADEYALENLVRAFDDPEVGVAYGRQLPHIDAKPLGAHARLFNYPDKGYVATLADHERMGIKAAFSSNSFAAYRRTALMAVGGFPADVILGEDTIVTLCLRKPKR